MNNLIELNKNESLSVSGGITCADISGYTGAALGGAVGLATGGVLMTAIELLGGRHIAPSSGKNTFMYSLLFTATTAGSYYGYKIGRYTGEKICGPISPQENK